MFEVAAKPRIIESSVHWRAHSKFSIGHQGMKVWKVPLDKIQDGLTLNNSVIHSQFNQSHEKTQYRDSVSNWQVTIINLAIQLIQQLEKMAIDSNDASIIKKRQQQIEQKGIDLEYNYQYERDTKHYLVFENDRIPSISIVGKKVSP